MDIRTAWPMALWLLPLISGLAAQGQTHAIWQIGKFDESPLEFSHAAQDNLTFEVGKSNSDKDWRGRQKTGHPYRILFTLDSPPGTYALKIAKLIEQPRVPALRIDVNAHAGVFFLHPKLSYSRSDLTYAFDPHESQSTLDVDIPSSFLKPDENAITP